MWEEMPRGASCSPGLMCVPATQSHSRTSSAAPAKHGGPKAEVLAANPGAVSQGSKRIQKEARHWTGKAHLLSAVNHHAQEKAEEDATVNKAKAGLSSRDGQI